MFATSVPSTVAIPPLRSLDDLPTELLVEIISYHRSLGLLDFFSPLLPHGNIAQRRAQREVLRCLSQTCSVVRAVCLSFLWERFDLTDFDNVVLKVVHRQAHSARFKFRALSLRSAFSRVGLPWLGTQFTAATIELQIARSQKELAKIIFPSIKCVNISMLSWYDSPEETMSHLVKFLQALPNLTTLRIHEIHARKAPFLSSAFMDVSMRTVTTLAVPDLLHTIFPAFPNVTMLRCPMSDVRTMLAAKTHFPRLHTVAGLNIYLRETASISALASHLPHLRAVSVKSRLSEVTAPSLMHFTAFANLSELAFYHEDDIGLLSLEALIAGATVVLRSSQSPHPKVLSVWAYGEWSGGRLIHEERWPAIP
ncbi:hypothetical protein B0H13DRAFT_1987685 [Mycena leptocephala]|nr:hypothetical protein B0H13DRAFT_1987685 [Mycena leptocephala]